jgi:hypothetical protein
MPTTARKHVRAAARRLCQATGSAPVVPDDHGLRLAELLHQIDHVAHQVQQRVLLDLGGRVRAAIAAHVGRHGTVAGRRNGRELMAPRVPGLRPAVTEQHERSTALRCDPHADAIDLQCLERRFGHRNSGLPGWIGEAPLAASMVETPNRAQAIPVSDRTVHRACTRARAGEASSSGGLLPIIVAIHVRERSPARARDEDGPCGTRTSACVRPSPQRASH